MDRPVSPDAPMIKTFILAMRMMLRVVLLSWKDSSSGLRQVRGLLFHSCCIGELLKCEVDIIVYHVSCASKAD